MLWLWVIAFVGYWLVRRLLLQRRKQPAAATPAAHTERLTELPEYAAAFKRYRLMMYGAAGVLSIGLLLSILISARPFAIFSVTPNQRSRDIMLCLDASGSLLREDTTLINRFGSLINNFNGQRFGITLFNSSAVTIIPLNSNYKVISKQLNTTGQAFKVQKGDTFTNLTNGTLSDFDSGTSLASDGLISCILKMGTIPGRSQSIILATDNEAYGKPIVEMQRVATIARQRNIHVYAIDPGVSDTKLTSNHTQLQNIALQTSGAYYKLSDPDAVNKIITAISKQNPSTYVGLPQKATDDYPQPFLYVVALMSVAFVLLSWRLRL